MWRLETIVVGLASLWRAGLEYGRKKILWAGNWTEKNQTVLFGGLRSGVKECQKQCVWKESTTAVSSVGVDNWSPSDVSISHLYFGNIVCSLQPGLHWIYIIDNYILASVRASQTLYSKVQIWFPEQQLRSQTDGHCLPTTVCLLTSAAAIFDRKARCVLSVFKKF